MAHFICRCQRYCMTTPTGLPRALRPRRRLCVDETLKLRRWMFVFSRTVSGFNRTHALLFNCGAAAVRAVPPCLCCYRQELLTPVFRCTVSVLYRIHVSYPISGSHAYLYIPRAVSPCLCCYRSESLASVFGGIVSDLALAGRELRRYIRTWFWLAGRTIMLTDRREI